MNKPLRLGIAGLGTVGTGLLQLLAEHGGRLAEHVGRNIEVVEDACPDDGQCPLV